jgi:hypothetical protein
LLEIGNGAFLDFHGAAGKSSPTDMLKMQRSQGDRHFQISKAIFTGMDADPTGGNGDRLVGVLMQAQVRRLP